MLEFAAMAAPGTGARVLAEHRPGLELMRLALREPPAERVGLQPLAPPEVVPGLEERR